MNPGAPFARHLPWPLWMAAALTAAYGLAALVLAALMALTWLGGRPVTHPLELLGTDWALLVPGEELPSPVGGAPIVITPPLIVAVAAGNLVVLGGAAAAFLTAAVGLQRRRRWARGLALILHGGTLVLGTVNLVTASMVVLLVGLAALVDLAVSLLAIIATLMLPPVLAGWGLLRPASGRVLAAGGGHEPGAGLHLGLIVHFLLVGGLMGAGLLLPERMLPHRILFGRWLVAGWTARAVSAAVAAAHLAVGVGFIKGRRWAYLGSLWLTAALMAMAAAALTAPDAALAEAAGDWLPAAVVRGALWVLQPLAACLLVAIVQDRRRFPESR